MIMAITSRIWIRPPMVYDETMPNSHNTIRTTQIVQSIPSSQVLMFYTDGYIATNVPRDISG
jgi:hypothetical protein